jgi:N-acetylglutamate synthase-like GNAT family acetyltransferase
MITVGMKKDSNSDCSDRSGPKSAFRKARAEDAPAILDVINETNKAFYKAIVPPDRYREPFLALENVQAESRRMTFYLCEQDDRTVGVIGLEERTGGIGVVGRLYVLPELQRRGVGTALLAHVEGAARRKRLREIVVWTDSKASWAVSFYKRHGFREIEPGTAFADPYIDDRVRQHPDALLVLRKPL